ncbi:MAG: hypothetical protein ACO1OB_29110 [Archangium sp.]
MSVLLANTYMYPVQPIAPAPGHSVPQNATAFVGPSGAALVRLDSDGGVHQLDLIDDQAGYGFAFYAPGPLTVGDTFFLGDGGTPVTVTDAAPLPTSGGELTFGPLEEDARYPGRPIWLRLPPEIEPWRAITRVHVTSVFHADLTGSDDVHRAFGLAADDTSGLRAGSAHRRLPRPRRPRRSECDSLVPGRRSSSGPSPASHRYRRVPTELQHHALHDGDPRGGHVRPPETPVTRPEPG